MVNYRITWTLSKTPNPLTPLLGEFENLAKGAPIGKCLHILIIHHSFPKF